MTPLPVEQDTILKRIAGVQADVVELEELAQEDFGTFERGSGWKLAQFHLHRALEGVFHISSHILSRYPGESATHYRELALKMGERGIVDPTFAKEKLVQMARYRNRLVHFYADISPKELYDLINTDLGDFQTFLRAIKQVLDSPKQFGLT